MPLWKIYHPAGAYTPQEKKEFPGAITRVYAAAPMPRFYVVVIFEEIAADSLYVGGEHHGSFVRIQIDQMARTLPGPVIREWWVNKLDEVIAPWIKDRGYDWEFNITEPPSDLWSLQGQIPPPFESAAERRWVRENKATPTPRRKAPGQPVLCARCDERVSRSSCPRSGAGASVRRQGHRAA